MKKLLFIIISLFLGIGIALIILESFLRLNPKFGYNYSLCKFKNEKLMMLDQDNFKYIRPSALLGYEIIPNSCDGLPVASNSYGLIGREYKLNKDKNTFRILLLGDSIAWQDWSRQSLEENLNRHPLLNAKYKFEIWNAGCPSYDVRRYYLYLKHKGLNYKPDMVIIFLFMNDFGLNTNVYYKNQAGAAEYYFPISEVAKRICVNPFLMKHAYLYRFIILRLDSYLLSKKNIPGANLPEEENGRYYLRMIKEICENKKIPLLAVIFPYLKPLAEYEGYQASQYKVILTVIKDLKINHLNLYEYLCQEDLYNLRGRKEDEIHPNCQTHRFIGKLIYDYLLNSDCIKK
jgi:hypothetical protein